VECSASFLLQIGISSAAFRIRVGKLPLMYAQLCANPLALTRSFHVFPVGIFPCFLKIFLIFDKVKNNKNFKPGRFPAFRRNSPLKYPLCGYPAGFENLPGKIARRFLK